MRKSSADRVDITQATLFVRHHFGSGIAVDAQLPTATVGATGREGVTQRLNGLGDIRVAFRYDLAALWGAGGYRPSVVLTAGAALPTGTQQRFFDDTSSIPVTVLATGRGAFAGQLRVEGTQFAFKWLAFKGWLGGDAPVTANALGITNGIQVDYGVGTVFLPLSWLQMSAQVSGQHLGQAISQSAGIIENSGGGVIAAEASVGIRLSSQAHLSVGARTPIFAYLNGIQVGETFSAFASISTSFGGTEEDAHDHGGEDEHDHGGGGDKHGGGGDKHDHGGEGDEHGDHEDAAKLFDEKELDDAQKKPGDVVDVARGGDSFVLDDVVEKGRITVIDYWAEWCEPCKDIDKLLTVYAAKYPKLAVRKVEVPTFSTAVAKDHLATAAGLPVVWIYNEEGTRVSTFEAADLHTLAATLEGLLGDDRASLER